MLRDVKSKKKVQLDMNIKLRKKMAFNNNGQVPLTRDEIDAIIKEETELANNKALIAMQKRLEEIDEMSGYMTKTREMLLRKFIDFNSMWQYDSEEIKNKIYRLLFDWKAKDGDLSKDDFSHEGKDDAHSNAAEGDEDDKEEKKKRQQLRLDQELFEFEERGGFAQVLKDIFNPQDPSSMELDSVFQLKKLCKAFYEKK